MTKRYQHAYMLVYIVTGFVMSYMFFKLMKVMLTF